MNTIIWVDDDSPQSPRQVEGFLVHPFRSCLDGWQALDLYDSQISSIIVDIVLPQDGWGTGFIELPGIEFVRHARERFGDKLPIVGYSINGSDERKDRVLEAGGTEFFGKMRTSFISVLNEIRKIIENTSNEENLP